MSAGSRSITEVKQKLCFSDGGPYYILDFFLDVISFLRYFTPSLLFAWFGFREGRSTVDAIQAVVDIATKARRGSGKRKGFCALVSIDMRNSFNTARWNICIEAMVRKKVPDYLLRMIDDYLSDR